MAYSLIRHEIAAPDPDTPARYPRSAIEDWALLADLSGGQGPSLLGRTNGPIRWVETDVFRMFQCEGYYIIVYPADWSPDRFSIMLTPGEIPALPSRVQELYRSSFALSVGHGETTWAPSRNLTQQHAGLGQSVLAMPFETLALTYGGKTGRYDFHYASILMVEQGEPLPAYETGYWIDLKADPHLQCQFDVLNNNIFQLTFNRGKAPSLLHRRLAAHEAIQVDEGVIRE